jgi:hypothetical protein
MGVWTRILGQRPSEPELGPGINSLRKSRQDQAKAEAAFRRYGHLAGGVTEYVWVGSGRCEIARRNNGRRFSYLNPPPEGHPGERECGACGQCRCAARPVIPQMRRFRMLPA